jgi:GNAT superfamily N-acetyltransferase
MSIVIRTGTKADIPFALNLVKELAVYEKSPDEVEDVIVGLALYYYKYSTWKGKCLFLEDIIVTESQRGKGLGKLLFDKVVQVSKEQKVRRMEWQVLDWNTPAIEFYKKYDANLDCEWVNCKLTNHQLEKM